ncbi:MAG: Mur ligase family protein [Waddliaceae bacterium]
MFSECTRVAVDSRKVQPGDLFIALKGAHVDGHDFLDEAKARGAKMAVVSRKTSSDLEQVVVVDPIAILHEIAKEKLAKRSARVIAITGSYGKTTTKEFVATLLEEKFCVWKTPGNCNSQVGLPLELINGVQESHEILILEMGMDGPGQLDLLTSIAPPDIAVITCVSLVHAANFDSIEEIAKAKGEILKRAKIRLIPYEWKGVLNGFTFSLSDPRADFYLEKGSVELPAPHFALNFLIASLIATLLGMEQTEILKRMEHLNLPEKRFQIIEKKGVTFVDDAYNACVDSVKAALCSMPKRTGRRIAVLGSMLELGSFSEACHLDIAEFALPHLDQLIVFGKEAEVMHEFWKENGRSCLFFESIEELMKSMRKEICEGDVVLIKGSHGTGLWRIVEKW